MAHFSWSLQGGSPTLKQIVQVGCSCVLVTHYAASKSQVIMLTLLSNRSPHCTSCCTCQVRCAVQRRQRGAAACQEFDELKSRVFWNPESESYSKDFLRTHCQKGGADFNGDLSYAWFMFVMFGIGAKIIKNK